MKLCQFCNEFACGQSGTKAISEHCGDKDIKIHCYVFSRSPEKAIAKIDEITDYNRIKYKRSNNTYYVETDNEIWEWIIPYLNNLRGIKPIKAFIDDELSIRESQEIMARCEFAVEIQYF